MPDAGTRLRLLVVTSTYPRWPGDTEPAFVHQLASRLTDRFDVVVATSRAPGAKRREVMDGVEVHRYAYAPNRLETLVYGGGLIANLRAAKWKILLLPTFLLMWSWQIRRLLRSCHFDAVHAHWFIPGALLAALTVRDRPLCVTAHGSDVLGLRGKPWARLRKFVAARASCVTAVGKTVQEELEQEGISSVRLLPMGVDLTALFVPRRHPESSRLLFVGRLAHQKRPEVALCAFAEALKMRPSLSFDIVGDGPERGALEMLARKLGIASQVTFHGRKTQDEVALMYRSAAAVVVASGGGEAPEGLGLVAVEALGCGCPVVSVPNAALQGLLPEGSPIWYSRDFGIVSLAESLLSLLDEQLVDSVAETSWRDELVRRFDWLGVAKRYGELLELLATAGQR